MKTFENIILLLAIAWPIWQVLSIRKQVINEGIVMPPFITTLFVFIVAIVLVIIFQWSPFHLLWMFVASFILGFILIMFPPIQKVTMLFLSFLALSANK
ncbi:MAG: hypothetical protein GY928_31500 [Colwellia sp.]|nr:hypothetical protein [Colwellia sp.]